MSRPVLSILQEDVWFCNNFTKLCNEEDERSIHWVDGPPQSGPMPPTYDASGKKRGRPPGSGKLQKLTRSRSAEDVGKYNKEAGRASRADDDHGAYGKPSSQKPKRKRVVIDDSDEDDDEGRGDSGSEDKGDSSDGDGSESSEDEFVPRKQQQQPGVVKQRMQPGKLHGSGTKAHAAGSGAGTSTTPKTGGAKAQGPQPRPGTTPGTKLGAPGAAPPSASKPKSAPNSRSASPAPLKPTGAAGSAPAASRVLPGPSGPRPRGLVESAALTRPPSKDPNTTRVVLLDQPASKPGVKPLGAPARPGAVAGAAASTPGRTDRPVAGALPAKSPAATAGTQPTSAAAAASARGSGAAGGGGANAGASGSGPQSGSGSQPSAAAAPAPAATTTMLRPSKPLTFSGEARPTMGGRVGVVKLEAAKSAPAAPSVPSPVPDYNPQDYGAEVQEAGEEGGRPQGGKSLPTTPVYEPEPTDPGPEHQHRHQQHQPQQQQQQQAGSAAGAPGANHALLALLKNANPQLLAKLQQHLPHAQQGDGAAAPQTQPPAATVIAAAGTTTTTISLPPAGSAGAGATVVARAHATAAVVRLPAAAPAEHPLAERLRLALEGMNGSDKSIKTTAETAVECAKGLGAPAVMRVVLERAERLRGEAGAAAAGPEGGQQQQQSRQLHLVYLVHSLMQVCCVEV